MNIPNVAYLVAICAVRASALLSVISAVRLVIAAWNGRVSVSRVSDDDLVSLARELRTVAVAFGVLVFLVAADGMYVAGLHPIAACGRLCTEYAGGMVITLALTFVSRLVAALRSTRTTTLAGRRDALATMSFWGAVVGMFLGLMLA